MEIQGTAEKCNGRGFCKKCTGCGTILFHSINSGPFIKMEAAEFEARGGETLSIDNGNGEIKDGADRATRAAGAAAKLLAAGESELAESVMRWGIADEKTPAYNAAEVEDGLTPEVQDALKRWGVEAGGRTFAGRAVDKDASLADHPLLQRGAGASDKSIADRLISENGFSREAVNEMLQTGDLPGGLKGIPLIENLTGKDFLEFANEVRAFIKKREKK